MRHLLFITLTLSVFLSSCKEKSPTQVIDENPEELITTVILALSDSATGTVVTASWRDPDGPGGADPVIDTLALSAGATYFGSIELLNESVTPADTLTQEIEEEANVHQLFYTPGGGITGRVNIERTDLDTNTPPLPIGLAFTVRVTAGGAAQGTLNIVLSHYDEVPKSADPGPESDIDVTLPVRIQ